VLATIAPVITEYVLASQSVHLLAPFVVMYLPAMQLLQTVDASEPENSPAAQSVQTGAPAAEYLPATQFPQSAALVFASEPEYLPAPQSVHATEPTTALYSPAAQALHVPPFGPVNPWLQTQALIEVCPVIACVEFDGQLSHAVLRENAQTTGQKTSRVARKAEASRGALQRVQPVATATPGFGMRTGARRRTGLR
jgi:hypothetical protein